MKNENSRCGFIAIVGVPNVGKSSLLNALLGQKISIVSSKPQTTRTRIMGILTIDDTQLIFIDTPGIHTPKNHLGEYMKKSIKESIASVDIGLLVVEPGKNIKADEIRLIEKFKSLSIPVILAINKIDLIKNKSDLLNIISKYSKLIDFKAIVPISVKEKNGLPELILELKKLCVAGPHLFDEDSLTDQPEKVLVSEIIREKILKVTDKEIPHGVFVDIETMKERPSGNITDIDATIYCEKESHKGIIIGKNGDMLKKIGTMARFDIEKFFGNKINLKIWVKVKEDWRNRMNLLKTFGYDEKNFK
ncbi:MAG: GTPase Era [Eubacteriales bacterium SKADARSKE-1]|nr:GTPase Era [Eubacteriales bacterium SKADARSKE-1]